MVWRPADGVRLMLGADALRDRSAEGTVVAGPGDEAAAGLETHCPLQLGAEAAGGLTPAAPDLSVRAWLGWAWSCPGDGRD